MAANRLNNAVGLCMRAGRLKSGNDTVEACVRAGEAKMVLLDVTASALTEKRCTELCTGHGIPLVRLENLGPSIGKPNRIVACVTDEGFCNMIEKAGGINALSPVPSEK